MYIRISRYSVCTRVHEWRTEKFPAHQLFVNSMMEEEAARNTLSVEYGISLDRVQQMKAISGLLRSFYIHN